MCLSREKSLIARAQSERRDGITSGLVKVIGSEPKLLGTEILNHLALGEQEVFSNKKNIRHFSASKIISDTVLQAVV